MSGPTKADLVATNQALTEQVGALKDRIARADGALDTEASAISGCLACLDDLTTTEQWSRSKTPDVAAIERVLLYLAERYGARLQRIPETPSVGDFLSDLAEPAL